MYDSAHHCQYFLQVPSELMKLLHTARSPFGAVSLVSHKRYIKKIKSVTKKTKSIKSLFVTSSSIWAVVVVKAGSAAGHIKKLKKQTPRIKLCGKSSPVTSQLIVALIPPFFSISLDLYTSQMGIWVVSDSHRLWPPCCGTSWGWHWSFHQNRAQRCRGAVLGHSRLWAPSLGW